MTVICSLSILSQETELQQFSLKFCEGFAPAERLVLVLVLDWQQKNSLQAVNILLVDRKLFVVVQPLVFGAGVLQLFSSFYRDFHTSERDPRGQKEGTLKNSERFFFTEFGIQKKVAPFEAHCCIVLHFSLRKKM